MIINFKCIHNLEADLWVSEKTSPRKKPFGKYIKHLFTIVNNELVNIKDWFTANKLILNVGNTKC